MGLNALLDPNEVDTHGPGDMDVGPGCSETAQPLPMEGQMEEQVLSDLIPPAVVKEVVQRLSANDAKRRAYLEREVTLSYYYGGLEIAYRDDEEGLRIVASGPSEEVASVLDTLDAKEVSRLVVMTPRRWEFWLASAQAVKKRKRTSSPRKLR